MNNPRSYFALPMALSILFVTFLATSVSGQKSEDARGENAANVKTVDARQSGPWSVGIDSAKNNVNVVNSQNNPVPVKVISNGSGRKPFQTRLIVSPSDIGFEVAHMPIPAGKRLVIEHVSVIARHPEGVRMEINYFTYFDNDGDGLGGIADISFQRITLTDQGTFSGTAISTANHKVLVFADGTIGTTPFGVSVQARLNGPTTGFTQAQLTFTGYLEDITSNVP